MLLLILFFFPYCLFCVCRYLYLCIRTDFVFYLCLYAGFIIGTCAVKPSRY